MEATIVSFRRGRRTVYGNQMIIDIDTDKLKELIGRTVTWISPGKNKVTIKGKITNLHGRKGKLRVLFERGMPGQSINTKVKIE